MQRSKDWLHRTTESQKSIVSTPKSAQNNIKPEKTEKTTIQTKRPVRAACKRQCLLRPVCYHKPAANPLLFCVKSNPGKPQALRWYVYTFISRFPKPHSAMWSGRPIMIVSQAAANPNLFGQKQARPLQCRQGGLGTEPTTMFSSWGKNNHISYIYVNATKP